MNNSVAILPNNYGTPFVRIFNYNGAELLNNDGTNIIHNLVDFDYTYDEESDDICRMVFKYERVDLFNNENIQQNAKLIVQWGYLLPDSEPLEGPRRKVAIRDVEKEYSDNKLEIKLICTDLVSFYKLHKTNTVRRYQNPNADIAKEAVGEFNDNYIDWLMEIAEGNFVPTITYKDKAIRKDISGNMVNFDYDPKTGRYQAPIDNARVGKSFYFEFHTGKVVKGKSRAIQNAIDDKLKWVDQTQGQFIASTTDDNLHLFQRNFEQNIYKAWVFGQEPGELISFKPKTDTRKVKKDTVANSNVNPYTKEVENEEISFADTSEGSIENLAKYLRNNKVDKQAIDAWVEQSVEIFKYNLDNPDNQKELPDIDYLRIADEAIADKKWYRNNPDKLPFERVHISTKELLNVPEFMDFATQNRTNFTAKFMREQVLIGHTVEKIQRTNTASAKVIGDPSLIKSKVYGFYGLDELDSGRWYASTVSHKITSGEGYICEMSLLKAPFPIAVTKNSSVETITNEENNEGELDYKNILKNLENENFFIYEKIEDGKSTYHTLFDEEPELEKKYRDTDIIDRARERVKQLNADEDWVMGSQVESEPKQTEVIKVNNKELKKILKRPNQNDN